MPGFYIVGIAIKIVFPKKAKWICVNFSPKWHIHFFLAEKNEVPVQDVEVDHLKIMLSLMLRNVASLWCLQMTSDMTALVIFL